MEEIKMPGYWEGDRITDLHEAKAVLDLQRAVLKTVVELVEFRDNATGEHIERTRFYLGVLIRNLIERKIYANEIDTWDLWITLSAAQLHDIGKIAVPDSILQKPDRLNAEEFEIIKTHALAGERVIDRIMGGISKSAPTLAFLECAKIYAGTHHEKWDGGGYPRGLKGEEIPLQGRLMAIADVYDALISVRPYKKALTHEQAAKIIADGRGTHFDPVLTDIFTDNTDEFAKISAV